MGSSQLADDGKANATGGTFLVARRSRAEDLENPFEFLGWDSLAVILDLNLMLVLMG